MTNHEKIKLMTVEELSLFLMKVNCAYGVDCMYGMAECKYPGINNNCSLCFRDWLESEAKECCQKRERPTRQDIVWKPLYPNYSVMNKEYFKDVHGVEISKL